jgi:bifunctional non-homologous end joining protein LigD
MGLQVYRKKRKFDVTPEPRGRTARSKGHRFVVQKHAARRLHYDFRLELDGVMKSWAVTRGPSLVPGEKRLAVQTEDHPIEYNAFEGTIPQGEYGGGTVMIWDRGDWVAEGDAHKGLAKGHLDFSLEGEKLHGRWHLVRMSRRPGESKDPWLLIKARDEAARESDDPDILEERPLSVVSGRSLPEIAEGKGRKRVWHSNRSVQDNVKAGAIRGAAAPGKRAEASGSKSERAPRATARASGSVSKRSKKKSKAKKDESQPRAPLPGFLPPSLATLREVPPAGAGWVHEIKFDGYRIQARLDNGKVKLLTRKGLDWTDKFPNIATAVARLPARTALIDGEVVIEEENGVSSFSGLQAALKGGEQQRFVYYVFDLFHRDGRDLTGLPLIERKAELVRLVERDPIRYSEHFEESGKLVLQHACDIGLEGIVSKRADAPYRSGRSDIFIKTKCANSQEFVVGGYSPSTAMPNAIGALVVGYYDGGRLIYAGRIGTGYTHALARDLWKRLHATEIDKSPFDEIPPAEARRRDIHWIAPKIVIESQFRGWTADKLVRQAAFKGVREDKPPREVVREMPVKTDGKKLQAHSTRAQAARATSHAARKARPSARGERSRAKEAGERRPLRGKARGTGTLPERAEKESVRFTHPGRVYWADVGVTKQNLADYYRSVWDYMAPHLIDRPLALVRCPDGTKGECFFQKHASAGLDETHLKVAVDKNRRQVLAVEDLDGLLSLAQAGVLEVHVRGSMIDRLDICNRIVFDIDPGPDVEWSSVIAAARDVRERLASIDLVSFVKLSGGKGLHVVLPIDGTDWDTTKTFAQAVTLAMNADSPDRYEVKMTKSLRKGKIFIDYFRNSLEQTSVAAYSTRARPGAPVSTPVSWEELGRSKGADQYTVLNLSKRLGSLKQDPWQDMGRVKQKLPDLPALRKR